MNFVRKLIREPLVHFLLIGAALFVAFGMTQGPDTNAANRIVVDAGQVEQIVAQFKRTWIRPPTRQELDGLIESYVREEVYYREARAMGLDQNDPTVRQRMRMKLEFILEDLTLDENPTDDVLSDYLGKNPDRFQLEPEISFTQVYVSPDDRPEIEADAERILAELKAGADPQSLGDTSMLNFEYRDMTPAEIGRTFGDIFAKQIAELRPSDWQGPFYSGLGGHLVNVTGRVEGRMPTLDEIRPLVEREWLATQRVELKDLAYGRLREDYEVVVELPEAIAPAATTATD